MAAQDFGLNAYYIAAKIRQENGGATASATAVNGSTSPFQINGSVTDLCK